MRKKKTIILLFGIGLLVRIIISIIGFSKGGDEFFLNYSDAKGYTRLAMNMVEGNGFSLDAKPPFTPTAIRTPGYPLFLSLSLLNLHTFLYAILLQILLGALVPIFSYMLLIRLSFPENIASYTSFFLALEPFLAAHSSFLLTEVLFLIFFLYGSYMYMRALQEKRVRFSFASGLLIGYAALIRPIGLYIIFLFTLYFFLQIFFREKVKFFLVLPLAMVFFIAGMSVVSPWMWRNWKYLGSVKLASIDDRNLLFLQGGSVLAMAHGTTVDEEKRKLNNDLKKEGIDSTSLGVSGTFRKKTYEIIAAHPLAFLQLNALTAWQFFTHDAYYDLAVHLGFYADRTAPPISILWFKDSLKKIPSLLYDDPAFIFFVGARIAWIMIFMCFLVGVIVSLRHASLRSRDLFLCMVIGYFLLASLTTGYAINARLRIPIAPFYIAYAITGILFMGEKLRLRKIIPVHQ